MSRPIPRPKPIPPGPGQESVWDYPRPPRLERSKSRVEVIFKGVHVADSRCPWRVLETSHAPVYYLPAEDVVMEYLQPARGQSFCEWKGAAQYFDLVVAGRVAERAAWCYPDPSPEFQPLAGAFAFYLGALDRALVDGKEARSQPGDFYGGWITPAVVGPFKGVPGSLGW